MSGELTLKHLNSSNIATEKFVTVRIGGHLFAVNALTVEDVLLPHKITSVPLVPKEIIGLLNLRGRIVTAIDLRIKMGMESSATRLENKSIVVKYQNNLYSLVVDEVTGVCDIPLAEIEHTPENLSEGWKEHCLGIYKLENELMVILNIDGLLHQK
jgi:purine-binding chemotaxis protein CheW